ncbi:MAG: protein phosphatase 2C domain-containing protein, partial [Prevotellaceae bacterium]|nr:protein phosphatase 2C domain-containing protein [Prevotellaceae bacterium]
ELSKGWSILVVSDGAGSAKHAGRGSKANCTISMKLLSDMIAKNKWIENSFLPSELDWYIEFRTICEKMKLIYQNKVEEMNDESVLTDFNATLLICVITPNGILSGHIGDGRMGYLSNDGEWKNLMTPHKGDEGNQTLFLQSSWDKPHVPALKVSNVYVPETRVIREIPKAVVLISDGCERSCWECSILDPTLGKYTDVNRPHPGFMNPLIESIVDEEDSKRFNLFVDIIDKGTKSCQTERDDKTMLIAMSTINYGISNI